MDNETILNDTEFALFFLGYCWTMQPRLVDECIPLYYPYREKTPEPVEQVISGPVSSPNKVLSMFGM